MMRPTSPLHMQGRALALPHPRKEESGFRDVWQYTFPARGPSLPDTITTDSKALYTQGGRARFCYGAPLWWRRQLPSGLETTLGLESTLGLETTLGLESGRARRRQGHGRR